MGNTPLVEQETDSQVFLDDSQTKTIECPNCKMTVPYALYCPLCGFPTYSIMNEDENKKESIHLTEDDPIEPTEQENPVSFSMVPITRIPTERGDEKQQLVPLETNEEDSNHATHIYQPNLETDLELESDKLIVDRDDENPEPLSHEAEEPDFETYASDFTALVDEDNITCRPDGATRDLVKELLNSANLMLWSIGQLLDGGMSEENFSRMFKGYNERWRQCTMLRLERLQRAKDTVQLKKELEKAKVNLGELELKLSIGDLLEGEYEAKAPAYRWEIDRFEGENERRKAEIDFLEDIGNVAPREQLERLEADATMFLERLKDGDKPEHSEETYEKIRNSLEETLQYITSKT